MPARDEILARLRVPAAASTVEPVPRRYRRSAPVDLAVLVDRLVDYRAGVHRCTTDELPVTVSAVLSTVDLLAVPRDLPEGWLSRYRGKVLLDPDLPALDTVGAVLTGCAVAIAETGTLVLDAGPGQGRRALTLVPDHHLCVVHSGQVVATVPEGLARLDDPTRPLTFISGPSATSDIELTRVEGVHGPRRLDVILVDPSPYAQCAGS